MGIKFLIQENDLAGGGRWYGISLDPGSMIFFNASAPGASASNFLGHTKRGEGPTRSGRGEICVLYKRRDAHHAVVSFVVAVLLFL